MLNFMTIQQEWWRSMPWNFVWGPSELLNEPIVYNDIHIAGITAKKLHDSISCCFFFPTYSKLISKLQEKMKNSKNIHHLHLIQIINSNTKIFSNNILHIKKIQIKIFLPIDVIWSRTILCFFLSLLSYTLLKIREPYFFRIFLICLMFPHD